MAKLKIRVEFFENQPVPVHQAAKLLEKLSSFLATVSASVNMPIPKEQWFGVDISGGSLNGDLASGPDVPDALLSPFYDVIRDTIEFGASPNGKIPSIQPVVLHRYADVAKHVYEGDKIHISVPQNGTQKRYEVAPHHATKIRNAVPQHVEYSGGAQGIIYAFTPGKSPAFFQLKELSTGRMIHCNITDAQYEMVIEALADRLGVVFVEGLVRENVVHGKVDSIDITSVIPAPRFSEKDFQSVFGCDPDFTNGLPTDEYLNRLRGHDD